MGSQLLPCELDIWQHVQGQVQPGPSLTGDVIKPCTVLPDAVHMHAALSQLPCCLFAHIHISNRKQNKG